MNKTSTNALCCRYVNKLGWHAETVQQWRGVVRHDLFNCVDVVAINGAGMVFIQNCSEGTLAKHRSHSLHTGKLPHILRVGVSFELWEWRSSKTKPGERSPRKKRGRMKSYWYLRTQTAELSDGGAVTFTDPTPWGGPLSL